MFILGEIESRRWYSMNIS